MFIFSVFEWIVITFNLSIKEFDDIICVLKTYFNFLLESAKFTAHLIEAKKNGSNKF